MAPPFRIAFATDENGDSCPTKLATTKELVLSLCPCLRFLGVVPIGAAPPLGHKKRRMFLLAAHLYRALRLLQPKCSLSVAVPSLLANMLAAYAAKLGLLLGPAPALAHVAPS